MYDACMICPKKNKQAKTGASDPPARLTHEMPLGIQAVWEVSDTVLVVSTCFFGGFKWLLGGVSWLLVVSGGVEMVSNSCWIVFKCCSDDFSWRWGSIKWLVFVLCQRLSEARLTACRAADAPRVLPYDAARA